MSELDDLRTFMQESFAAFDPTIDTSSGSSADAKVITPLIQRLAPDPYDTPIDQFTQNRLAAQFPDLVVQSGEPIVDLVAKPFRILMEPFRRVVVGLTRNQSLADPSVLNSREADNLAGNYFTDRKLGGFSIGTARLYFSAARYAQVTPTNQVFTASGLNFFPVEIQSISADSMLFNTEGSLFFFDIIVRAEAQGKQYDIDPNSLIGIQGFPAVVKVGNPAKFTEGDDSEDTATFLARVKQSLTEKSLVTGRGISARLTQVFSNVTQVLAIGMGDPEMIRDILTGSPDAVYALGLLTARSDLGIIQLMGAGAAVTDGSGVNRDFIAIGVEVGDTVTAFNMTDGTSKDFEVTEVISQFRVRVHPTPMDVTQVAPFLFKSRDRGSIFISDIPGGIIQPNTPFGTIQVPKNQVHIGGAVDVYVRAGAPQAQSITLSGLADGDPLHFGLDLQSFGADSPEFVQVTPKIVGAATTLVAYTNVDSVGEILIQEFRSSDGTVPWKPTTQDVNRFIELLGSGGVGAGSDFGVYQILAILDEELVGGVQATRIQVNLTDRNTNGPTPGISNYSGVFNLDFRIVDQVSPASWVRDRAFPPADFNGNQNGLGSQIGDSVVIETGTDAGIYSIRRILSAIGEDDTLVLDRDLTATVTPSGVGDHTGLRYRLADELQVSLVAPRVTKIPLGDIFPGNDLETVAGSATVLAGSTTNFLLAGVAIGDTLQILSGDSVGLYTVQSVSGTSAVVAPPPPATGFNLRFTIYRAFTPISLPLVRVTSVALLDSTGQSTGITVPYGDSIDARVLGKFSNRANGDALESFHGSVLSSSPLTLFQDTSVDFLALGIRAGFRMQVLAGPNFGEYEVAEVIDGNNLTVLQALDGGKDFEFTGTNIHYILGEPSAGFVRLYFLDPTSVDIETGPLGGRLQFQNGAQKLNYRFSKVQGRQILPAPGGVDALPRDLRVVRSYSIGGGQFESILEITDPGNPDAFEAEIVDGDIFDIHEPIPLRNAGGNTLTSLGLFGTPSGLHTLTGSNRVFVPQGSRIDFTQMGDLEGQTLYINAGIDTGQYTVARVIGPKVLELNAVMTSSSPAVKGQELSVPFDAFLEFASGNVYLHDDTDFTQLGSVGDYVTIFEAAHPAIEGTYQIAATDPANHRVQLTGFNPSNVALGPAGTFSWIVTGSNTNVSQPFGLYTTVPKSVQVTQVATKAPDVTPLGQGNVTSVTTFKVPPGVFASVRRGDRLELLTGISKGIYPVFSSTSDTITVYAAHPFGAVEAGVTYRVWAGLHGPRRMVTVASFEDSDARVQPGALIPYSIRRPGLFRISSTEIQNNVENGFYYVDVQVESLGPGDERNLDQGVRIVPLSGLHVDGYTYRVKNKAFTFSPFEDVSLSFTRRFLPTGNSDLPQNQVEISGRNVRVDYENSTTVNSINNLMRSDNDRPINASPIARHFLPSFVYVNFVYQGGSSVQVTGPDIENYINTLSPLVPLQVSQLEAFISRRGATSIKHPIELAAVTHDLDRKLVVDRSENQIGGTVVPYDGTARITSFFATLGEGLVVTRQ